MTNQKTSAYSQAKNNSYILSPEIDFLFVGGIGLISLIAIVVFVPTEGPQFLKIVSYLYTISFFINYPHFAFSYQLLYCGFTKKISDHSLPRIYRLRLWNAGIFVPAILFVLLGIAYINGSRIILGYMASAMFLFVGWHYVKQGYGMLVVLSAKKGYFF
jgi:hypothetical protein